MTPYFEHDGVTLHLGDCIDVLPGVPDASIDAIVTDPPYEIGFMGRAWDAAGIAYSVPMWHECLRVLKPGGHLLAFGAPRTYHRLACAIEDAGFEIRDSIHWIYGQGFPKSLDVSKAIDKAAGVEREPGSPGRYASRRPRAEVQSVSVYHDGVGDAGSALVSSPATAEAQQWQGWGTALKPAHEPIVVARKPFAGTVAANVLEHGTGAMNIDACRVGAGDRPLRLPNRRGANNTYGDGLHGSFASGSTDAGRWPTNVVLAHHPDCIQTGARTIRNPSGSVTGDEPSPLVDTVYADRKRVPYAARETESVAVWDCADGCPVAEMDRQSGIRPAGVRPGRRSGIGYGSGARGTSGEKVVLDAGGASRYFPVFRYQAKAPASERPRLADGTAHTTVKPLSLVQWLVRLVTPPDGVVLDPFAGSGTTLQAALAEGLRAVGIEREPEYAQLCVVRLTKPVQGVVG